MRFLPRYAVASLLFHGLIRKTVRREACVLHFSRREACVLHFSSKNASFRYLLKLVTHFVNLVRSDDGMSICTQSGCQLCARTLTSVPGMLIDNYRPLFASVILFKFSSSHSFESHSCTV
ncbi:hypothetical protein TNCT_62651 [Trichonephila clavata]|uniref:Uncharacterized protein n=1 Tax=Trichonephila clavata TaxID=2740835 RepID=A0A8X6G9P5_TRICU|nr:hypothetical protein TNCT_62651 [Trichonephila clavata]